MKRKIFTMLMGAAFGIGVLAIAPAARADQADEATRLTFNEPVQVPGNTVLVLPAGTYWFKVPGSGNVSSVDQNLVRIYNSDQTMLIATLQTIPTIRTRKTIRGELVLAEQPNGNPVALLEWFYPDRTTGHQFIYAPTEQSQLMAETRIEVYPNTVS